MPTEIEQSASVAEQAAQWWITFHSAEVSVHERHEFDAWVAQSPERVSAYLRTALVLKAAKSPRVRWPDTPAEALVEEAKRSLDQRVRVLRPQSWKSYFREHRESFPTRRWLVAITALFGVIGVAWLVSAVSQEFHTGFGERRSIRLSDGSMVTLNSESKITLQLRKDRRLASLEAGEAFFSVSHDASRPFEVSIGKAVVRDLGTEFDVNRGPKQTVVTVLSGKVAVLGVSERAANDARAPSAVLLGPAERLVISNSGWGTRGRNINVRAAVSWMEGKLTFEHTRVLDAAEEFNRYNRARIEIQGAQLQRREVSGVFQVEDTKSFLTFLSGVPGVSIHEAADGTHVVTQN